MSKHHALLKAALTVLGLAGSVATVSPHALAQAEKHESVREIEVIVDSGGYKPSRIQVQAGETVRLKFVRKDDSACTREVVFPKLGIRRQLPTNQPVIIELSGLLPGEYEFRCGMNMIRGTLIVTAHRHH